MISQCKQSDFGAHGLTILDGRMKDRGARWTLRSYLLRRDKLETQQVVGNTCNPGAHRTVLRFDCFDSQTCESTSKTKKVGCIQNEVLYKFTRSSLGSLVDVPVLPAEAVLECSKIRKVVNSEQGVFAVFSQLLDKHFTSC